MPDAPSLTEPAPLAPVLDVSTATARCAACGEALAGPFCHGCGERAVRQEDESLAAFLREQFHEVTSADGKMWRTARALFVPGRLTAEYFAGRRGLYLRPVRVFLVLNVLFFLLLTYLGGQAFRGDAAMYRSDSTFAFNARMTEAAAEAGVEAAVYDAAFGQKAQALAPTLIAAFVPVLVFLLALALWPVRPSLARHAVFATHFVAVVMAMTAVVGGVLLAVAESWLALGGTNFNVGDQHVTPVLTTAWTAWLVVGIRRVYGAPWWGAGLAGMLLGTVGVVLAMLAYRWLLFYVTLWTLDVPT